MVLIVCCVVLCVCCLVCLCIVCLVYRVFNGVSVDRGFVLCLYNIACVVLCVVGFCRV